MTGTEHPPTEEAVARLWNTSRDICAASWERLDSRLRSDIRRTVYAAFGAGREHERARPGAGWEPLAPRDPLYAQDEVRQVLADGVAIVATVARVDMDGTPWSVTGTCIGLRHRGTWFVRRAPVTWYRLPTEPTAHLWDVTAAETVFCDHMSLDRDGTWVGVDSEGHRRDWVPRDITTCTLDGIRLKRDGDFEDGEPRFVERHAKGTPTPLDVARALLADPAAADPVGAVPAAGIQALAQAALTVEGIVEEFTYATTLDRDPAHWRPMCEAFAQRLHTTLNGQTHA